MEDPGSARYGNFINYYTFNPAENRVICFPDYTEFVNNNQSKIVCLDVGCNVGEMSQVLLKHLGDLLKKKKTATIQAVECAMLAVDFDQHLIDRANGSKRTESISFECADVLSEDFVRVCNNYLRNHDRQTFDIVYCFSTTMWVHLNHGDEALSQLLQRLSRLADLLVLEPQPWKCYTRAVRRMKKSNSEPFQKFGDLKIRSDVEMYINSFLVSECGYKRVATAPTSWNRLVSFYKKS